MGTAGNDLFNSDFTSGDLSKIQPVVRFGQMISVWVISVIGFAITISTVLKVALHALYATNTKFWDRVDEVHRMKAAQMIGQIKSGGNEVQETIGFLINIVFSLLPNVKAITEFDGDTVDTKTFFTRAIPAACVCLFVGVFVFYGYTTKFGEKFSQFGTTLIDNYFMQIDPFEFANKIPTSFTKLNLGTDNAINDHDEQINKVAKKSISTYLTLFNDTPKDMQNKLALEMEDWVRTNMSGLTVYTDMNAYSMTYTAYMTPNQTAVEAVTGESNSGRTYQYSFTAPAINFQEFSGTAKVESDSYWIRVDLQFNKVAEKDTTKSVTSAMSGGRLSKGSDSLTVNLGDLTNNGGATLSLNGSTGYVSIGGKDIKGKISMAVQGGDTIISWKPDQNAEWSNVESEINSNNKITIKASLVYSIGGKNHQVSSLTTDSGKTGAAILFTPTTTSDVGSWTFGENPNEKAEGSSGNTNNVNDGDDDDSGDDDDGDAFGN